MKFTEFYNIETQKLAKQNVLEVQELAKKILNGEKTKESNFLLKKIKNRIKRWGTSSLYIDIVKKIVIDYDIAMEYAKPPTKQNISETLQLKYLLEYKKILLKKLPSSGKKAMRFIDGDIVFGKNKDTGTKSFDFRIGENIFTYNKVTTTGFDDIDQSNVDGGSQKNQYNDSLNFLKQANLYCEKYNDDKVFILIVDGDYYDGEKIEILKRYENKRVIVTNCDEFKI
jgi:hypothetical protein